MEVKGEEWEANGTGGVRMKAFGRELGGSFGAKRQVVARGILRTGITKSGWLPCNNQGNTTSISFNYVSLALPFSDTLNS